MRDKAPSCKERGLRLCFFIRVQKQYRVIIFSLQSILSIIIEIKLAIAEMLKAKNILNLSHIWAADFAYFSRYFFSSSFSSAVELSYSSPNIFLLKALSSSFFRKEFSLLTLGLWTVGNFWWLICFGLWMFLSELAKGSGCSLDIPFSCLPNWSSWVGKSSWRYSLLNWRLVGSLSTSSGSTIR